MLYPYDILGVAENASTAEIRQAYLKLVHKNSPEEHPDKFQQLNEAYNMIKDEKSRAHIELFGLPFPKDSDYTLADLSPKTEPNFSRPGVEAWKKIIRKGIGNE